MKKWIILLLCLGITSCSLMGSKKRPENDACALRKQWWALAGLKRFAEARELLKQNENKPGDWCVCPAAGSCFYDHTGPNPVAELMQRTDEEEQKDMYSRPKEEWAVEYKPFNDTAIAKAVADAQKRCQENTKWVFNIHKRPTHTISVSAFSPGEVSKGRYDTKDKCEEARLNSPEDLRPGLEHDRCYKKYFGKKVQADVIVADYMYKADFGSVNKNSLYFTSNNSCEESVSKGFRSTTISVGPSAGSEQQRFIGKCKILSLTICDTTESGLDIAGVNFVR